MEKNYKTYLNSYAVTHSPNSLRIVSQVIRKLPPLEQLTRDSILVILGSYENIATRRLYYKNIKLLLRYLGKSELLEGIHIKTPKTSITRADLLTQSEVSAILRACKDPLLRGLIEFLLESGARISEALNLTINDLIIEKHFIITTLRSGKTNTSRQVPLLRDNLTGFLYYLSTCDDHKVFPIKYDTVWIKFKTRLKRSGIKPHRKLFHIFRHMKATHLLDLGVPETIIKQFMGWSSLSNMMATYTHLSNKSVMDFFSRLYGVNTDPLEDLYAEDEKERLQHFLRR